jgi:hypothetical protein
MDHALRRSCNFPRTGRAKRSWNLDGTAAFQHGDHIRNRHTFEH